MSLLPAQCRAARALLNWSQNDLVARSGVAQATVANFERGASIPYPRTLRDIRESLEKAGVAFLDAEKEVWGVGLRFQWGSGI